MAEYAGIKGFSIQSLAADPYASTVTAATWASGNNANVTRAAMSGTGTLTAGLITGGGPAPQKTETEEYDGTSWTEVADLNRGRENAGCTGPQSAAMLTAGYGPPPPGYNTEVETWDGTSWTEVNNLLTTRASNAAVGITTAALCFGGTIPASPYTTADSETYDGTSWTEGNNLNTSRSYLNGGGLSTDAIALGGYTASPAAPSNAVETYDGTSWTTAASTSTARQQPGATGLAPTTDTITYAGSIPPGTNKTEHFNGSAWTELADLANPSYGGGSGGSTSSAAFYAGGNQYPSDAATNATEEFQAPSTITLAQQGQVWYNSSSKVLKGFGLSAPAGSWSSGGTILSGRMNIGYAGTSTSAMIIMGGYNANNPAPTKYYDSTESYDGSTWTEVNNLNAVTGGLAGMGTSTAAIETGGGGGSLPYISATELWDGTSWTETGHATNAGRETFASGGSSTAAMIFGGVIGTPVTPPMYYIQNTEIYNGTTWTEVNNLLVGRQQLQSSTQGTTTAMLAIAGELESGTPRSSVAVEHWDGTSWTEGNDVTNDRQNGGGAGTSTNALRFGGSPVPGGDGVKTEIWDGTSWSEVADLATGRTSAGGGNGVSSSAVYAGGKTLPTDTGISISEEWAAGEAIKTFTAT